MSLQYNMRTILCYKKDLLLLGLFFATVCSLFYPALIETWSAWQKEEYSHGYLIPLIGMVLIASRVTQVNEKTRNSWLGLGAVIFCILIQFLFLIAGIKGLQPLLLVCFFLSYFLLLYGIRFSLALAGPLAFFFFLAPLPKFLYYTISFKMQILSTTISVILLQATGMSVFQDGNIIDLGITKLQVVEACNGLRYLFPLMALGYLLAYMYKTSFLKRAILFLSTIPITILMNSLRIYVVGVSSNLWGPEMAEGLIHNVEGWVVFLGCLLVLGGEILLMQKFGAKGHLDFDVIALPSKKALSALFPLPWQKPAKALIVVFVGVLGGYSAFMWSGGVQINPVPLEKPLSEFPMQIGNWGGHMSTMDADTLEVLGTENYLLADYTNPEGDSVNLYMLYFPKQDSTSNQAVHTPEVCIPGGGWEILSYTKTAIEAKNGLHQPVNRLVIAKGLQRQLVYYWFFQGEDTVLDVSAARFAMIKRSILERKTNGGMIRLVTPVGTDGMHKEKRIITQFFIDAGIQSIKIGKEDL